MACSVAQVFPTFCDLMDCSPQAPLAMEFSRQEYWSRLPCTPPGYLPNPGIEPRSPTLQVDSLLSEPPGKPKEDGAHTQTCSFTLSGLMDMASEAFL